MYVFYGLMEQEIHVSPILSKMELSGQTEEHFESKSSFINDNALYSALFEESDFNLHHHNVLLLFFFVPRHPVNCKKYFFALDILH